jgi:hypothetical protein
MIWLIFSSVIYAAFVYQYFWYPDINKYKFLNLISGVSLAFSFFVFFPKLTRPFSILVLALAFVMPFIFGLHQNISLGLLFFVFGVSFLYFLIMRKANSEEFFQ